MMYNDTENIKKQDAGLTRRKTNAFMLYSDQLLRTINYFQTDVVFVMALMKSVL